MKPERLDETGHRILVDIDALFDTRFGTLAFLYPDEVQGLIEQGYRTRRSDNFNELNPVIDNDQVAGIYRQRDNSILALSRLSNLLFFLTQLMKELAADALRNPGESVDLSLVVNTYPYDLGTYELQSILLVLQERLGSIVDIKFIHKSPAELNIVSMAYQGFTQYIVYDINEWCLQHYGTEEKIRAAGGRPDFIVIAPKLFKPQADEQLDEELKSVLQNVAGDDVDESVFELTVMSFAPQFTLTFLEPVYYSLIDLKNPPIH